MEARPIHDDRLIKDAALSTSPSGAGAGGIGIAIIVAFQGPTVEVERAQDFFYL